MNPSDTPTPDSSETFYPENASSWKSIALLVQAARRVFVTTHVNPDGDALGSEMAVARFLAKLGKPVRIVNTSKTPAMYAFLDSENLIESYELLGKSLFHDQPGKNDLIMILDLSDFERIGEVSDFLLRNNAPRVIIDHHESEPEEADVTVLAPYAESTGSLVYDLLLSMDHAHIDIPIAEAILTAVLTDTGYFSFSNTNSISLGVVSSLYKFGVSVHNLRKRIDATQPLVRQKLLGLCLAEADLACRGRAAWSYISAEMFRKSGTSREHTEGIINHLRVIEGVSIAVLFIQEEPLEWKISFRSATGIRVNSIAAQMGGGGHEKAAGAALSGTLPEVTEKAFAIINEALDSEEDSLGKT